MSGRSLFLCFALSIAAAQAAAQSKPSPPANPALDILMARTDELEIEIQKLIAITEELRNAIDRTSSRDERAAKDIEFRLKSIETRLSALEHPSSAPAEAAPANYDQAYGLMKSGDLNGAVAGFRSFLAANPKAQKSADAQFWIGESLYTEHNYTDAAAAYVAVLKNYGGSANAPNAMLKLGMTLNALKQSVNACATLRELPKKYPKADTALKKRAKAEMLKEKCA